MNEPIDPHTDTDEGGADDPILEAAGARLRAGSPSLSPAAIQLAVLRRRSRRLAVGLVAALVVVAAGAGALALTWISRCTGT